jgi:TonB-dependent Receptor Plug Domain
MKNRSLCLVAALVVAVVPGCASSSSGAAGSPSASQQSATHNRGARDRITAEDLATIDVQNALQAVQRLRPNFLQNRGGASTSITQGKQDVVVYVDQTRMGGPNTLSQIPITDVKEIQHLNGTDATQRYGTGHGSGVILVIRK